MNKGKLLLGWAVSVLGGTTKKNANGDLKYRLQ